MGLKTKNVPSKSTLQEPIKFQRMASSLMVEVTLFELKLFTCQILNGGWKSIVNHTHDEKNTYKIFLNIICMYC